MSAMLTQQVQPTEKYRDEVMSLNCVYMATKYSTPCYRAKYVWYLTQNRRLKYISEQAQ